MVSALLLGWKVLHLISVFRVKDPTLKFIGSRPGHGVAAVDNETQYQRQGVLCRGISDKTGKCFREV